MATGTTTATYDYRPRAVGGPAVGYGQKSKSTESQHAAQGRPAVSPWPVVIFCFSLALSAGPVAAQANPDSTPVFTHADTLRGSQHPAARVVGRDVLRPARRDQSGRQQHRRLQRDHLPRAQAGARDADRSQEPLVVDSIVQDGRALQFRREGNAFFVDAHRHRSAPARRKTITVYYHGKPADREAPAVGRRLHLGAATASAARGS